MNLNQQTAASHPSTQQYKISSQQINIIHHPPPPPPSLAQVPSDSATPNVVGHIDNVLQTRGNNSHSIGQQQQPQQNSMQRFSNIPGGGFAYQQTIQQQQQPSSATPNSSTSSNLVQLPPATQLLSLSQQQQQQQTTTQRRNSLTSLSIPQMTTNSNKAKKSTNFSTSAPTTNSTNNTTSAAAGGQNLSFKALFSKYLKKRSRSGQYDGSSNNLLGSGSGNDDTDEKLEFMAQIISVQSAKIKRLEDRLRHIEMILPDYGTFEPNIQGTGEEDHEHDGEKEKRPQTAYQSFMQTEIPKIKAKNPDIAQKDAFKIAANNWTSLKNEPSTPSTPTTTSPTSTEPPNKKHRVE